MVEISTGRKNPTTRCRLVLHARTLTDADQLAIEDTVEDWTGAPARDIYTEADGRYTGVYVAMQQHMSDIEMDRALSNLEEGLHMVGDTTVTHLGVTAGDPMELATNTL